MGRSLSRQMVSRTMGARPLGGGRGFTLIELLVVVSIIALLVAMLLPSLADARAKGKMAICLSNLRQIGNGMHTYFAEYQDTFPWFCPYECQTGTLAFQCWYYGGRYPVRRSSIIISSALYYPEDRPLNRYLCPGAVGPKADCRVYRCPTEMSRLTSNDHASIPENDRPFYELTGTSYCVNLEWPMQSGARSMMDPMLGLLPDYADKLLRYKLVVRGSETFVMLSPVRHYIMLRSSTRLTGNHAKSGFNEMLFLDGHADHLLTDVWSNNWRTKSSEWTLWFSEPLSDIPAQFRPPFPGVRDWQPP